VTHVFPSPGLKATVGWGEGQGEGSSEILQTGLERVVAKDAPQGWRVSISWVDFN